MVSMVCFIAMTQLSLLLLCFVCMMLLTCICGIPLRVMYVWLIVFCQQLAMVTSQSSDFFSSMLLYSGRILCYSEKLSDWHLFSSSLGKVQIKPVTATQTSVTSRCMVVKCMNSRKCWFYADNFCNHTINWYCKKQLNVNIVGTFTVLKSSKPINTQQKPHTVACWAALYLHCTNTQTQRNMLLTQLTTLMSRWRKTSQIKHLLHMKAPHMCCNTSTEFFVISNKSMANCCCCWKSYYACLSIKNVKRCCDLTFSPLR